MGDETVPPINFGKKKKKPKNPLVAVEETTTSPAATTPASEVEKLPEEFNDTALFGQKRKKKPIYDALQPESEATVPAAREELEALTINDDGAAGEVEPAPALLYTYEELLQRIFDQLIANNPELATDVRKKLKMPPPLMARVGTKKTQFTNFTVICKSFNRDPAHLSAFFFAELGTTGSIDANGALIIRGKYMAKHIEPLLQSYARNYVKCSTCGSHDTILSKDARLLFLICKKCSSKVTVKNVTSGFQAVTDKRAAIRAKAQ
nr:eukaryotic translation initiation factor 2 [Hymenolepis microstoma]